MNRKIIISQGFPKISIVTCVYNGEKYISKLLDSVLNMGYPNIEHIIVDDGSTDKTKEIVMKYVSLYEGRINTNLCIKYIRQKNMGLGGATNTGLKEITGDYWTWINCDDWYEPNAFFDPIQYLEKNKRLDYLQLNGFYENKTQSIIIDSKSKMAFTNKKKLFSQYAKYGTSMFRYLLFICRFSSYSRICPSLSIYPSKYTQDDQFISQIFGTMNGQLFKQPVWHFLIRDDSFNQQWGVEHASEKEKMCIESIRMLNISPKVKRTLAFLIKKKSLCYNLSKCAKLRLKKEFFSLYHNYIKEKDDTILSYRLYYKDRVLLYLFYTILFGR